jgi:DNA polymerase-3 subunit gamma/tau
MGIALYRKYRPQTFSEVAGQNHILVTLRNELSSGSVAHAYLFTGPRGVGKTTMARIFAKALNCLKRKEGESEPCNECEACLEQRAGRSLDVVEIDAASHTQVDSVRDNIIERVRFAPTSRKFTVFIIDEVHMLSSSAWNALLKTVEEPPAHAIFVMATTEVHKVPATIISRCQRFDFKRIPQDSMIERLKHLAAGEGVDVDLDVLEAIVKLSDGCLRDSESMLEQVLSLGEKRIGFEEAALVLPRSNSELVRQFVEALAARRGADAVALVGKLVDEGVDLTQFANETVDYLRAFLLAALGAPVRAEGGDATRRLSAAHLARLIESMLAARTALKSTPIPQLPFELVAAEHCGDATSTASAVEVNSKIQQLNSKQVPIEQNSKVGAESENLGPSVVKPAAAGQDLPPLETMALRWDELCQAVSEENPSLPFLLRVARPLRFEDRELVIGVRYKMHADKLNSIKHRSSIAAALTSLYNGANIPVRAETVPDDADQATAAANAMLDNFGGTLVE